jgi:hypothetical protein
VDDHELERMLRTTGRESRLQPSHELVQRTRRRIRGTRLLPTLVFASLAFHLLVAGVVAVVLLAPALSWLCRASILAGLSFLSGAGLLVVVAARDQVAAFCTRLELLYQ